MTELQNTINEKIFKKTLSRSGKTVFNKKLVGHLVAGIVDDQVSIGYSLLHKNDNYDMVNGRRCPGHGKKLAFIRAQKWADKEVITVPPSIAKQARKFADRCERYYKGAYVQSINEMEVEYHSDLDLLTGISAKDIEGAANKLLDNLSNL